MHRGHAIDPRGLQGAFQATLDGLFVQMVPADDTAARITRAMIGGEHPVPAPGSAAVRVFSGECTGHFHPRKVQRAVLLPKGSGMRALLTQIREQGLGEHGHTILAAFAVAHHDDPPCEVHVLDAQAHRLHQAHTGAVQQATNQSRPTLQLIEYPAHLIHRQHRRDALANRRALDLRHPRQVLAEHFAIEEKESAQRLLVGGCGDFPFIDERVQEAFDIGAAERSRVATIVETHIGPNPVNVSFLGTQAVVQVPDVLTNLVQQARGRRGLGVAQCGF